MRLIQRGNPNAKVMVVGEAPGADEDRTGKAFVGLSGQELDHELGLAGWSLNELFFTNVCHERPPGNEIEEFFYNRTEAKKAHCPELYGRFPKEPILRGLGQLREDVNRIAPTLIICLGNTSLWALTGQTGVIKWRGSILPASGGPVEGRGAKLIPTLHPAAVLREFVYRAIAIHDLKRAHRESRFPEIRRPNWNFAIPKTVAEVRDWFDAYVFSDAAPNLSHGPWEMEGVPVRPITADVENIPGSGELICLGFGASKLDAMCVPFMHKAHCENYWDDPEQELAVTDLCIRALRSRPVIFHNGLHDCQIIARTWGIMPNFEHDTMVGQHVRFPGMLGGKIDPITGRVDKKGSSLSLAFCSSMYCNYHRFWKDDGRDWDPEIHDESQFFNYNCEDNVRTYEVFEREVEGLHQDNLWNQYLMKMEEFGPVFQMMFTGVNFDRDLRRQFKVRLKREQKETQAWIDAALGHELNTNSAPQMQKLFYEDMQVAPILHRKTKKPTLDDKALDTIKKRVPVLKPLIDRIQGVRSARVFKSNFLDINLGPNGRLYGAFNPAGPETMRFSSNANAFDEGFNLQNIPIRGVEDYQ